MNAAYFEEILSLSKYERLLIVQRILESIRMEEEVPSELSDEWKAELDRRSQLLAEGKTELFNWEEIKTALTSEE